MSPNRSFGMEFSDYEPRAPLGLNNYTSIVIGSAVICVLIAKVKKKRFLSAARRIPHHLAYAIVGGLGSTDISVRLGAKAAACADTLDCGETHAVDCKVCGHN